MSTSAEPCYGLYALARRVIVEVRANIDNNIGKGINDGIVSEVFI